MGAVSGPVNGYIVAGFTSTAYTTDISYFPYASPYPFAGYGVLSTNAYGQASHWTSYTGYQSSGDTNDNDDMITTVSAFPLSVPFTVTTSIGNMAQKRFAASGHSSYTAAYSASGQNATFAYIKNIETFPFASPFTTAASIGTLAVSTGYAQGTQSFIAGFVTGANSGLVQTVYTFPFVTGTAIYNTVGNLVANTINVGNHQYNTSGLL